MNYEPAVLVRARQELGVRETPGPVSTAKILDYRKMAGLSGIQGDDGVVPWCAIFVNAMLREVKLKGTGSAMARSFSKWGNDCPVGTPGAVTVISSSRGPTSGHVFINTGRITATHIEGVGGNQSDAVTTTWWPRARIVASRWPAELTKPLGKPVLVASTSTPREERDS